jgi:hypothetical protein
LAWISVHEQVLGMKLREFSKKIGCSQKEGLGILVSLWLWGINNADRDGLLRGADKNDIIDALSTGLSIGLSVGKIVECLLEYHWIDYKENRFYLHDWDFWQEQWYKAIERRNYDAQRKREERTKKCPPECPQDSPPENPLQPSPSPSPSPSPKHNRKEKDYSLQIENFRQRYSDFLNLIDTYFDILRTTRVSGKISDSVICQVYEEMNKHPVITVKYACKTIVDNPVHHSKKENYLYGIMRNTRAEEAEEKLKDKTKKEGMTAWGTQIRK